MKKLLNLITCILFFISLLILACDNNDIYLFTISKLIGLIILTISGFMMHYLGLFD